MAQASRYAKHAKKKHPDIIAAYVFGCVARKEEGFELGIIFEVGAQQYDLYWRQCRAHSINWAADVWADPDNTFWLDFPPFIIRSREALQALISGRNLGLSAVDMAMRVGLSAQNVNVICMPKGWHTDPEIRNRIQAGMPEGFEGFIERLAKEAIELK